MIFLSITHTIYFYYIDYHNNKQTEKYAQNNKYKSVFY